MRGVTMSGNCPAGDCCTDGSTVLVNCPGGGCGESAAGCGASKATDKDEVTSAQSISVDVMDTGASASNTVGVSIGAIVGVAVTSVFMLV